ncbi:MAG: hypothetical protein K2X03_07765 [Bryobacteraceae bacterium]|nr:hypothetical protein [Bryobacteraceae bacterium]
MGYRFVRFATAFVLMTYGFAKINGSQFTILDSELDKPMGQVSGFWLTWYFFGYSAVYGNCIALTQIMGALLLTFQRTALLGACILAPMLVNIVAVDLCYGVDLGATITAMVLLIAVCGVIARHASALRALLFPKPSASGAPANHRARSAAEWAVRVAMLVLASGITYWVANYNNRRPTPIDGTWDVGVVIPESAGAGLPRTIYFEYNRAFWAAFKMPSGKLERHHFEVDPASRRVVVFERWLGKGKRIFEGDYRLAGVDLTLKGNFIGTGPIEMQLRKRSVR